MSKPNVSKKQISQIFGCSIAQLNKQYEANAKQLRELQKQAETTGKKVRGYTAIQLAKSAEQFEKILLQNENEPIASIPAIQTI